MILPAHPAVLLGPELAHRLLALASEATDVDLTEVGGDVPRREVVVVDRLDQLHRRRGAGDEAGDEGEDGEGHGVLLWQWDAAGRR